MAIYLPLTEYSIDLEDNSSKSIISLSILLTYSSGKNSRSGLFSYFLFSYVAYVDLLLHLVVFIAACVINIRLIHKSYYMTFNQINLFSHKLQSYTKCMLKPLEITPFSIDDLLFPETSEISDFFLEFFEMFEKNSAKGNNSFDMTDSVEKITSQLKKTRVFRKRFDESDYIRKAVNSRYAIIPTIKIK